MRILQISQFDLSGGAEQMAWDLHRSYRACGHESRLLVGWKRSTRPDVVGFMPGNGGGANFTWRVIKHLERKFGIQALGYPWIRRWWRKHGKDWDIVHLHNMHGGYFDLGILPLMARESKVVITLHDCWLFTGHCAHPMECNRWQVGCGRCPDLARYPGIERDSTRFNWRRKRRLLQQAHPTLVAPSQWLADLVAQSPVLEGLPCRVIYNGIDTDRFSPGNRIDTRRQLRLPNDKMLLLYVANKGLNATLYKDSELLLSVLRRLIADGTMRHIHLVVVGGYRALPEDLESYVTQFDYLSEGLELVYQASDVAVYPTKADNCPLVPLEAMSSGMPVISTAVGGVPELVVDGETGYLVAPGDADGFAEAIRRCLDRDKRSELSRAARQRVEAKFSLTQMTRQYIDLYRELAR